MSGPLVAVLDYGIGNLSSAQKALCHVGADARLVTTAADAAAADGERCHADGAASDRKETSVTSPHQGR